MSNDSYVHVLTRQPANTCTYVSLLIVSFPLRRLCRTLPFGLTRLTATDRRDAGDLRVGLQEPIIGHVLIVHRDPGARQEWAELRVAFGHGGAQISDRCGGGEFHRDFGQSQQCSGSGKQFHHDDQRGFRQIVRIVWTGSGLRFGWLDHVTHNWPLRCVRIS